MFDEFKSPFQRRNNAHVQLIIINVIVFVVLFLFSFISKKAGLTNYFQILYNQFSIPSDFSIFVTRPWTIITYFFTHSLDQIWHILFNMLALYWFGRVFVEYLGSDKLVAVYVLGGLAGAILYLMAYNLIPNPPDFLHHTSMVGASAGVFAVMVATATLLPNLTFFLFLFGPVKIKYIAAFYIILSLIGTVGLNAGGEIAHIGGALIGFAYIKQLQAGSNWGMWITAILDWIKNLFTRRSHVKVTYRSDQGSSRWTKKPKKEKSEPNKVSQEEIDAILDKISDGGYESLTRDEKEKLFNASKKS
jgi:membrane associated rhomboid family serine protease